jgi:hypothetical protein
VGVMSSNHKPVFNPPPIYYAPGVPLVGPFVEAG